MKRVVKESFHFQQNIPMYLPLYTLAFSCITFFHPLCCDSAFQEIEHENLKTLSNSVPDNHTNSINLLNSELLQQEFVRHMNPSLYEKRRALFHLLKSVNHPFLTNNTVLDKSSWQDLNFLCGPASDVTAYLAAKIDRTHTELGKIMLFYTITHPTNNIQTLEDRQAIVQELIYNVPLFDQLTTIMQELHDAENVLPTLCNQQDMFKDIAQNHAIRIPLFADIATHLNKNSLIVEANERMHELRNIFLGLSTVGGAIFLPLASAALLTHYNDQAELLYSFAQRHIGISSTASFFSFMGFITWLLNHYVGNTFSKAASYLANGISYGNWAYYAFDDVKTDFTFLLYTQTKLIHFACFVRHMSTIHSIIHYNKILHTRWPGADTLNNFFYKASALDKNLGLLLSLLSSKTFKDVSSLFSQAGNILVAFRLINQMYKEFQDSFMALAQLDVYLSTAQLYKEGLHNKTPWTFPLYKVATNPSMRLKTFWNPFISSHHAVTNNISLGIDENPRSIIITGPNAGGKSTTMKGIIINIILAQSLGIAPSQELILTPFTKIMTYLAITDDIAAGNSHFKAGVLRAHYIITEIENLNHDEFCFVALDEVFNGTTYAEGQAAAYSLIEFLGNNPNVILTTATHFPRITNLEQRTQGKLFKNYKVSVIYDEQGNIQYPFKLSQGIADQKIALAMLHQEGFSNTFLTRAYELLAST